MYRWSRLSPVALAVLPPALLWGALFILVPPARQEFPLNDDWAFARTAFALSRGEGLHYYRWASMPLLGQLLWSVPFVRVLGESHVALRLATMVLACLGLAAFYDLLRRESGLAPRAAAFTALCLAFNPLYFLLGAVYQTDVPALALSLIGLALYARGLRGGGVGWWLAGAAVALLAVSTRQNAVVTPVVAGALLWRHPERRLRAAWLLGAVVPAAAAVAIDAWFGLRPDVLRLAPEWRSLHSLALVFVAVHLLGLSALPLLVQRHPGPWKVWLSAAFVLVGGAVFLAVRGAPPSGGLFPYIGDWLTPWGQFPDNRVVGHRPLLLGSDVRWALTLAGCLAGALLVARLVERGGRVLKADPLVLFALLHFPFLLIAPTAYDRYLIVLLPGALVVAAAGPVSRFDWPARLALLTVFAGVSFAFLHDLLAWNSACWELGRRALARGIAPAEIEGGFPWDGWYAADGAGRPKTKPPSGLLLPMTRVYFPHVRDRFALSFSEVPGTHCLDAEPYRLWLIPGEHRFLLLERGPPAPAGP
jgi:4-amino-4-deoxy-L-arabinose transferase-like glycosyltransferase